MGVLTATWAAATPEGRARILAAPGCYERLGTLAQMNPPIPAARHQAALWEAIRLGLVDLAARRTITNDYSSNGFSRRSSTRSRCRSL